ncbi:MAG: PAS domain-containing sensor histidine kinase [Gemmatimonadota bacterium]|nr:PAS domain-containing sensor histidine kinase [Gemmatimonadota bacterium]
MDALVGDVLDTAPCGFISFGDDGTIRAVNATLLEMLGYERGELLGRHVQTVLATGSRIFYQTHFFPLIKLHGRAEEIFLILQTKGGGDVGVLTNAVRRERDGAIDCILIRVQERRKYEDELLRAKREAEEARRKLEVASEALQTTNEELVARTEELERQRLVAEEANRAKSNFLAVMSHELRTPLNAIGGYTQLIEMGVHGAVSEGQRNALDRIARSQHHLMRLINDLLNLARIESGRVEYAIADVRVAEVLAGVTPLIEPQIIGKGLVYEAAVVPDLAVRADREKLQQILLNLLTNAVKFTPAGGRVTVDAAHRTELPDVVFVRITDTGVGIPAEMLESVFEAFVQVEASRRGRAEGTGLGLAISRDLARGMGGDLRARSDGGQGSTFTLTLPVAKGD